jgi:gamma-glutamyltranspeptidase / glutathione hydrolase
MSTQQVYFNNPSDISALQTTINGYSTSFTTNTLNVSSLQFADDNVFGTVNSATGVQWVTVASTGAFVACEDNYACQAALQCMASGGNAFDAAVTAMAVLGLTRPGNCGLGGGGYAVMYHKDTDRVDCMDFREAAPIKLDPYCYSYVAPYSTYNGSTVGSVTRSKSQGYAVGVPGTPMFMKQVLEKYGTYNLGQCFYPAIKLATGGFYLDQTFVDLINLNNTGTNYVLSNFTGARNLFLDPSTDYKRSYPVGTLFKNTDYATTLQLCANTNMKAYYYGVIGQDIVNTVQSPFKATNPSGVTLIALTGGNMTMEDLALYNVLNKVPIKISFRDCQVYVVPPSTSGGLALAQALKIYEQLVPSPTGGFTGCADSYFARQMAIRYAWADRNAYVADPMFYQVPTEGMLDSGYISYRASICPTGYNTFTSSVNAAQRGVPTGYYSYGFTGTMLFPEGSSVDPTSLGFNNAISC